MNGFAKQLPHLGRPQRTGLLIKHSLEIAKLMLQAKLKDLGRRLQLRAEAIANPDLGFRFSHQLLDDGGIASRGDEVIDSRSADKNPMPEVASADASAGLIALDHGACNNLLFDLRRGDSGLGAGASDDRGDP